MTFNSTVTGKTSSPCVVGGMVEENTESGAIKDINVVNQREIGKKKKPFRIRRAETSSDSDTVEGAHVYGE